MEKRDLIKDEIERLGKALGKIVAGLLNLKAEGKISKGVEQAREALQALPDLNLDIQQLVKLKDKDFLSYLTANTNFSEKILEQLADIFSEIAAGEMETEHKEEAQLYIRKALAIYEFITTKTATYSLEREEKVRRTRSIFEF